MTIDVQSMEAEEGGKPDGQRQYKRESTEGGSQMATGRWNGQKKGPNERANQTAEGRGGTTKQCHLGPYVIVAFRLHNLIWHETLYGMTNMANVRQHLLLTVLTIQQF